MKKSQTRLRGRVQARLCVTSVRMALALCVAAGLTARAQDAGKPVALKAMAKEAAPDWEVATVKPSDPDDTRGQHIDLQGSHVLLLDTTVEQFLLLGYGIQQSQLAGEPEWVKTTRWDVDGVPTVQGQPNLAQVQMLIRNILTERFGLQFHHEQREMPVFAMTVAKGGPKMVANTSDPNGLLDQQGGTSNGRHVEALKNTSMAELAFILQFHVDRPVVDQTGLKGRYDLNVQWTVDDAQTDAPDAPPGLAAAMQEQVGLRLDRVKGPADVLVLDKVDKPGAN
jgi:uncharacterized protein (TIGR03435 family)